MKLTTLKSRPLVGALLLILLQTSVLKAEEVQLFDQPPSAKEMGALLFGHKASEQPANPGVKMRSIGFVKKVVPTPTAGSIAENARTELASIGLPIKFANNSDQILTESLPFLQEIGKMLTMDEFADKRMVIEGHTDSAGSDVYNRTLSQRRANAVSEYLAHEFGISKSRLKPMGMGESKPLPGHAPEDEANRRVQFYSLN